MTVQLSMRGTSLVDPALVDHLKRHSGDGVVDDDRTITIDDFGDTDLVVPEDSSIEPGDRVSVSIDDGFVCKSKAEQQRARKRQRAKQRNRYRKARLELQQEQDDAEAFWNRFEIPFEHDVSIKGRLSGLSRGSDGSGRDSRTVEHLWVQEAFSEGRLERDADSFLCTPNTDGSWPFEEIRHRGPDGDEYMPEVTCERCRLLMERWLKDEYDLSDRGGTDVR